LVFEIVDNVYHLKTCRVSKLNLSKIVGYFTCTRLSGVLFNFYDLRFWGFYVRNKKRIFTFTAFLSSIFL